MYPVARYVYMDDEKIDIIGFEDCKLDLASLTLNIPEDDDLKLVAANFEDREADVVEVELEPVNALTAIKDLIKLYQSRCQRIFQEGRSIRYHL